MPAAWLDLLLIVVAANSAPILLARILGHRFDAPIDGGHLFVDQQPLLGPSKTWRGLFGALILSSLIAPLLSYPIVVGASAGLLSMLGDLLSSFIKRRLKLPSSSQALLLDQLPEALLPAIALSSFFEIGLLPMLYLALSFLVLELTLSKILFKWGVRKHPY